MTWIKDPIKIRFAGENTLADPSSITLDSEQCVSAINHDIDDEGNAVSRDGFSRVNDVATRAMFGQYCVQNDKVCVFDGTVTIPLSEDITVGDVHFEMVNEMVVFSDGLVFGLIENGAISLVDNVTDWATLSDDIEQWVKDKAPADFQAVVSNFEVDMFKLSTLAGKFPTFYDGAIYLAVDNFLYRTKAFDVGHMDIRYNIVAGFAGNITAVRKTADGLYVGTATGTYFLNGHGFLITPEGGMQAGFEQKKVDNYGIIEGTAITVSAGSVPHLKQSEGEVVLWASRQGIMAGLAGGNVVSLSVGKTQLPNATKGTAFLKEFTESKLKQYIVCFDVTDTVFDVNNELIPTACIGTWVVNLTNLAHSRYRGYPFNSFHKLNDIYYGASKLGIFTLGGSLDFANVPGLTRLITAPLLSVVTDLGEMNDKFIPSVYVLCRCEGNLLVDVYVDEVLASEGHPVDFDDSAGMRRRRCKLPKGLHGTNWQFLLYNKDGERFTAAALEPVMVKSSSRIS